MFLSPTNDQALIAETVADVLLAEAPFERWFMPGTDMLEEEDRLFRFGVEMGWIGFGAPADVGGSEASLIEEMLVVRELGARLAPLGIVPSIIAARIAAEAGSEDLAADIISGTKRVALSAETMGSVLIGGSCSQYALITSLSGLSLAGVEGCAQAELGWDGMASVVRPDDAGIIPAGLAASSETVLRFRLLVAAQLQGIARTAVSESAAYARMREQFGRAIGSFQAVRHRVADMEMASRRAEAALFYAAASFEAMRPDAGMQIAAALFLSMEAAIANAQANIANHGAIGVTQENIAHLLIKRALLWKTVIGGGSALLDGLSSADGPLL